MGERTRGADGECQVTQTNRRSIPASAIAGALVAWSDTSTSDTVAAAADGTIATTPGATFMPDRAIESAFHSLTPERTVRLLRAKVAELESMVPSYLDEIRMVNPHHVAQDIRKLYEMAGNTLADVALIAALLADEIERRDA
jgi:hypothetical protein